MTPETLFSLHGKTALVTGGATGIGRMAAEALVMAGARVLIASRKGDACAAVAAARLCGAPPDSIGPGLSALEGLPHRLEEVGERGGILFVNDSLATTPEAAAAGLEAYAGRPVVLIAGGASKGARFEGLGAAIARSAAALVTLGEEGPAIAAAARAGGFSGPLAGDCPSMEAAVQRAAGLAAAGGVVLLSPGCASFGMFTGYAARGEAFRAAAG